MDRRGPRIELAIALGIASLLFPQVMSDAQDPVPVLLQASASPLETYPGDSNGDGQVDISDAVSTLLYLFGGGPAPGCLKQADANSDDKVDVSDAIYLLGFLFLGGPQLPGWTGCYVAEHCAVRAWEVFCVGHWECQCGECRAVCESETCGDGVCDLAHGETAASCPGDCKEGPCRPVCANIGTRSEGWYDSCTGKLIRWEFCGQCRPVCLHCPSKSEGWYDSCTGELIEWADCDCAE